MRFFMLKEVDLQDLIRRRADAAVLLRIQVNQTSNALQRRRSRRAFNRWLEWLRGLVFGS